MKKSINEQLDELRKKIEGLILFLEEYPQFKNDLRIINLKKQYSEELKKISKG